MQPRKLKMKWHEDDVYGTVINSVPFISYSLLPSVQMHLFLLSPIFSKFSSDVVDLSPEENWSARRIKKWSEDNKADYQCIGSWSCAIMNKFCFVILWSLLYASLQRASSKALNGREGTQQFHLHFHLLSTHYPSYSLLFLFSSSYSFPLTPPSLPHPHRALCQ